MNIRKSYMLVFALLLTIMSIEANENRVFSIPEIQVKPIKDTQSNRDYELYIKLPESYFEQKKKHYPVIYFTDAIWHIEILSAASAYLMEEAILVGVSWQKDIVQEASMKMGEHASRFRDYTINKSSNPAAQEKYNFGQASEHLSFIRQDVIKYIERNYRIDKSNRSYFGYSLGSQFGVYVLLTQPETFNNYILGSPAIAGGIDYLTDLSTNLSKKNISIEANVFISYGQLEKKLAKNTEKLIALLKSRGDKKLSIEQQVIESADHQRAFPQTGVRSVTWLSNLYSDGNKL